VLRFRGCGREDEAGIELRPGGQHGVAHAGAGEADVVATDAPAVGGGDVAAGWDADGAAFGREVAERALENGLVDAPVQRGDEGVVALDVAEILVLFWAIHSRTGCGWLSPMAPSWRRLSSADGADAVDRVDEVDGAR
jgi:hypothetical protein